MRCLHICVMNPRSYCLWHLIFQCQDCFSLVQRSYFVEIWFCESMKWSDLNNHLESWNNLLCGFTIDTLLFNKQLMKCQSSNVHEFYISFLCQYLISSFFFLCDCYLCLQAHTLEPKVKPDKLHRDRLKACLNKVSLSFLSCWVFVFFLCARCVQVIKDLPKLKFICL